MNITHLLTIAGVPDSQHGAAIAALMEAEKRAKGLTWAKWQTRLFRAGKIAESIPWLANRLIDVKPEWADCDIAPMLNITAHGDNGPWIDTPEGNRPYQERWLNPDPASEEYQDAVRHNYWCPGEHPRSQKSRKAWYRRNGGEYLAWERGMPVGPLAGVQRWQGRQGSTSVQVMRSGDAWIVNAQRRLLGRLILDTRIGFEVDNIFQEIEGRPLAQAWYPCPGYELRAPVTWGTLPAWGGAQ